MRPPSLIQRTFKGYKASNFVDVRFRKIDQVGFIVSHVVENGGNNFRHLLFQVTDQDNITDGLRADAVRNARKRAALYAHGASMKLGRILAINPNINEESEASLPVRAPRPLEVAVTIEPGVKILVANVTATWELVPE